MRLGLMFYDPVDKTLLTIDTSDLASNAVGDYVLNYKGDLRLGSKDLSHCWSHSIQKVPETFRRYSAPLWNSASEMNNDYHEFEIL